MTNRNEILTTAANGNAAALDFLQAFARRAHWIDDLADGDKPDKRDPIRVNPFPDVIERHESEWLLTLSGNAFFLAHRAQLVPAMVLALNAWVDSHRFEPNQQAVIKGQWHEVVYLVAWLVGGTDHLREVTGRFREYDVELPINGCLTRKEANGTLR